MKERIKKSLKKKEWPKKDIEKAVESLASAERKKSKKLMILDEVVYWSAILLAIIGTMVISIMLIPFLILLNSVKLMLIITILGFTFGMLFEFLLRDLRDLNRKHYIIAGIFIPAFAVINMTYMAKFTNHIIKILEINSNYHSPILIGGVYVIAFIAPAALIRLTER